MKTSLKIFLKFCLLAFLLFITPLSLSIQAAFSQVNFNFFKQNQKINPIDISTFNVMDMVKKENIPPREVDIDKQDDVEPIDPVIGPSKSIYLYSTHQKENYKDKNTVMEASHLLAEFLRQKGFEVVVEERDFTSELNALNLNYNQSYRISRNAINDAMVKHGGFDLLIDFHRDSIPRNSAFIEANGKSYAKMMIVLGGLSDHFLEIQKKAVTLLDKTNAQVHGIMKNILVREAYYNQDIHENMLLIEVGGDESMYEEVTNSVEILANAIDEMMR